MKNSPVSKLVKNSRSLIGISMNLFILKKFKLGEVITITSDNVSNFEYNGQELKKGMEIFARVRSPAWYYKGSLITKASVIEIKGGENK